MKKNIFTAALFLGFFLFYSCEKGEVRMQAIDNIELSKYEYVDVEIPRYFGNVPKPASNEEAALGRILFYDTNLSLNNSISCGTCHQQSKSFSDGNGLSAGLFDKKTTRNTISIVNCSSQRVFLWDNQDISLEELVLKPISDHIEMGITNIEDLPEKLQNVDYYPSLFEKVYGSREITTAEISSAMAQFIKSMYSYNSKYDVGVQSDFNNFTISELRGKEIFFGKGNCGNCHNHPTFTTKWGNAHNIGLDMEYEDPGFQGGKFKVPTLRNIELTAPYMHDGRFETLEAVVDHYNEGIKPHPYLSFYLRENFGWQNPPIQLNLSTRDKEDLIAFMNTLTDHSYLRDPKFANPFN